MEGGTGGRVWHEAIVPASFRVSIWAFFPVYLFSIVLPQQITICFIVEIVKAFGGKEYLIKKEMHSDIWLGDNEWVSSIQLFCIKYCENSGIG